MKKRLLLPIAVLGAGVMFSGCTWFFAGSTLSDLRLKPGEKSVVTVHTHPLQTDAQRSYPFFLLAFPDDGALKVSGPKRFDDDAKYTSNGKPLVADNDLRDQILTDNPEECGGVATNSDTTTYRVFRTQQRINDKGKPQLRAVSKLGLKQVAQADASSAGIGIATGFADLDEDGDLSDAACTGGSTNALFTKPAPSPRAESAERERLRAYDKAVNG